MVKIIKIMIVFLAVVAILSITVFVFINQRSFGHLPQGTRLERIKESANWQHGEFQNKELTSVMTSDRNSFSAMWQFLLNSTCKCN